MGMLFVRCKEGLSHTPLEYSSPEDVAASAAALLRFLEAYTGVAAVGGREGAGGGAREEL